jgi:hypothetical protein
MVRMLIPVNEAVISPLANAKAAWWRGLWMAVLSSRNPIRCIRIRLNTRGHGNNEMNGANHSKNRI